MNIVEQIREETRALDRQTAIIEGEKSITYGDLLARVRMLSETLAKMNIRAGQRIAFRSADGIDYIVGALALLECGAAVVPLADSLTATEALETIDRIKANGILARVALPRLSCEENSHKIDANFNFHALAQNPELDARCRALDAAFIRFSSGTTGVSKGVTISHRSIIERTDAANRGMLISDRDVILWTLGMSHHFVVSILLFLRKGATIVVANQRFPFSVLEAAQRVQITFIYGSPVHFYLLAAANQVSPDALRSVRMAISTSMKMPADIHRRFSNKFGFSPSEAYGIIEIGLPFINSDPGGSAGQSVGRILPDYQLRIENPDPDGVGEILVKGKGMFDAYFSPWQMREQCLRDGWFDTGDMGRVDESGRLFLLGRSKTVIVCAGMKIFPEEVEEVIGSHPQVRESLVLGKEHPQFGQIPIAQVVVRPESTDPSAVIESLRGHCCQKLSSYKVPVEFRAVSSLPRGASGKLLRSVTSTKGI